MKNNNKTRAEVLILLVLAIILAFYIVLTYCVNPIKNDTAEVNKSVSLKETTLKSYYYTIQAYGNNSNRLNNLAEALKDYSGVFYDNVSEEMFLDGVSVNIKSSKTEFVSLSAVDGSFKAASLLGNSGNLSGKAVNEFKQNDKLKDASFVNKAKFDTMYNELTKTGGRMEDEVKTVVITLEISGEYNSILDFLKGIVKDGKNVVCNSLTMDIPDNVSLSASDNPEATAEVTLTFLRIPDVASIFNIGTAEPLPTYVFPKDILDGSYKKTGFLSGLFG